MKFKYAVCNEMFGTMDFARSAEIARSRGFEGMEIAPFTLFGDFSARAVETGIRTARAGLAGAGVAFAGLHWLFVKPEGLHVTSKDPALRKRSWDHLRLLLDIAGELGGGPLVFGSPKQRASRGVPVEEAQLLFTEGLISTAELAVERKSRILIEALPSADTDVVNTLFEANAVAAAVNHPGVEIMFDFHNTKDEEKPWPVLIEEYQDSIRHVHVNEMDGRWPGTGTTDFRPAFAKLAEIAYEGWISLEIFTTPEDPAAVLGETMETMKRAEPAPAE